MKTTTVILKGFLIGGFLFAFLACKEGATTERSDKIAIVDIPAHEMDSINRAFDALKSLSKPGVSAAIIKDNEIIYLKGFGSANLETATVIDPKTKFQLGALSKQFTTLALLLLEEEGKVSRSDDIRKYLPQLPEYRYIVTVDHLLNHSSGLYDIGQINHLINGTKNVSTQAKAMELIASQKTFAYEPGTDFSFIDAITESVLMAEIVSKSSGQTFADFVKTNIFEPLGMQNSLIRDNADPY